MAADHFAGVLANPLALVLLVLLVAWLTSAYIPKNDQAPIIRRRRLLPAYVCALLACALASAVMSYTSPEEALLTWNVPPEKYWTAQLNEFLSTFVFAAYATLIGIAAIGLPITLCILHTVGWPQCP